MTRAAYIAGVARAQSVARAAILEVAQSVRPGDTERSVAARIEQQLEKAHVRHWLHTPYAWWGERARFDWHGAFEPNALPSERRLLPNEAYILDVAPIVDGFPADFAFSGFANADEAGAEAHGELLKTLAHIKQQIVDWARAQSTQGLCQQVAESIEHAKLDVIHTRYPAQVLGHSLEGFPNWFSGMPRIGSGFQLPLLLTYATGLLRHHLTGADYPFLNAQAPGLPRGLYAVEPHLGTGNQGAKFESVLLVDGDETRWLDPELYGEVLG